MASNIWRRKPSSRLATGNLVKSKYGTAASLIAGDFFEAASGPVSQTLAPGLFTDADTFFAHSVAIGAVTLVPNLYTDADIFYAASISQGGSTQTLSPSLYTDSDAFYAASLMASITLSPTLYSDADAFYAATVSNSITLTAGLFNNSNTFYSSEISQGGTTQILIANLYVNNNIFYDATISQNEIITGTGFKYVRKSNIQRVISKIYQPTAYVDDEYELPEIKDNQVIARTIQKPIYQPYENSFLKAIENSHLKTSKLLKDIAKKSKVDSDSKKLKDKQEQERKEKEAAELEAKRLQDEEEESILMLMFEMM